ncbi:MAG: amidohydrolase family protein [Flavobacteriales bacterium]|nr:amidohydrolase family protein [Flavobacteriales bacterium]MDW8431211.1 amidohydrolase family protein [Flavobacteriales bacterium]
MNRLWFGFFLILILRQAWAQSPFAESYLHYDDRNTYALVHATVIPEAGREISNATLVWKEGKILSCLSGGPVPQGAVVLDGTGYFVYPAIVDLWADYGLPAESRKEKSAGVAYESERTGPVGSYESNRADYAAGRLFQPDEKMAAAYRKAGVAVVLSHKAIGNIRGSAVLVSTGADNASREIIRNDAAFVFSLNKTDHIRQFYPTSLAGAIALIRQTFLDAEWYRRSGKNSAYYETLERFSSVVPKTPLLCEVMDKYDIFRMQEVAAEFGVNFVFKGVGNEYQRASEIAATGARVVVPLQYPEGWDVSDPEEAKALSFNDLKHWELAPHNALFLHQKGVPFAFTTHGLKNPSEVWDRVRRLVRSGLPEEVALRALTSRPAEFIGAGNLLGVIQPGAEAHFILASGRLLQKPESIFYTVVRGRLYLNESPPRRDLRGIYKWEIPELQISTEAILSGTPTLLKVAPRNKKERWPSTTIKVEDGRLSFSITLPNDSITRWHFSGAIPFNPADPLTGQLVSPEDRKILWKASRIGADTTKSDEETPPTPPGVVPVPFSAFGLLPMPSPNNFVVRGATVWTNEPEGIRENCDVYVKNGKIEAVGQGLRVPSGTPEVDGRGRHLTCGIIDEHSHIALTRGVNEWGSHASAEVRMYDAVEPDDEDIYRQLAGGVTAAQLLHGSANPIGGQSALVKFRWGALPQKMRIEGADNFIKFALGENVKQGNNPQDGYRYPQSRTGVEATFYYYFLKARAYGEALKKDPVGTRRDLRLETLLRILDKKCFITCHSYVQSEINMLMKLADSLGFKVNTFTHILEGYKVADKMKAHGVHASSFSDWWAYKWEVMEAIPYNPALLIRVGVNTAINSDDAEMARRLNQEAAKVVKYGGISEEDAWKTVTLNPAKMLHLDHRMGSIRPGKDADLVLWDGPPLSIYSKPLSTWVDGVEMFSIERDKALRDALQKERRRLLELMVKSPNGGKKPTSKTDRHYHCDTLDEAWEAAEE